MRFPFPEQGETSTALEQEPALAQQGGSVLETEVATVGAQTEVASNSEAELTLPAESQPEVAEARPMFSIAAQESLIGEPYALRSGTPADVPRPRVRRKILAFPRPAADLAQEVHRLADPVVPEHPRILDVPEELEALQTTPFLEGLQLHPEPAAPARDTYHAELPLLPATMAQRMYAAGIDCGVVGIAGCVFAVAGYKMLPGLTFNKSLVVTAAVVPVLLWAMYQYVLLVYAGATAGMRMAGVRLKSFQGTAPGWRDRRSRVLCLYLSIASLAMGLLWAFVDIDALCWHDRISRTYLVNAGLNDLGREVA